MLEAQPYPLESCEPVACQETIEMLEITGHFLHNSVAQCGFLSAWHSFIQKEAETREKTEGTERP